MERPVGREAFSILVMSSVYPRFLQVSFASSATSSSFGAEITSIALHSSSATAFLLLLLQGPWQPSVACERSVRRQLFARVFDLDLSRQDRALPRRVVQVFDRAQRRRVLRTSALMPSMSMFSRPRP